MSFDDHLEAIVKIVMQTRGETTLWILNHEKGLPFEDT